MRFISRIHSNIPQMKWRRSTHPPVAMLASAGHMGQRSNSLSLPHHPPEAKAYTTLMINALNVCLLLSEIQVHLFHLSSDIDSEILFITVL